MQKQATPYFIFGYCIVFSLRSLGLVMTPWAAFLAAACSGQSSTQSRNAPAAEATDRGPTATPQPPASRRPEAPDSGRSAIPPGNGGIDTPSAGAPPAAEVPHLAVNTQDPVLPLGRTRGLLAVVNGCVTFKVRDQLFTPVWPEGTRLSPANDRVIGPAGQSFLLGADATLDGASFSLRNPGMRLRQPLPARCPNATYAVNI